MSEQEITAEMSLDELAPAAEPQRDTPEVWASVTFAAKTDLGSVRENNEDKFDWWEPDDPATLARRGRLYAVADGMGGHAAGQIAAEMALKRLGEAYYVSRRGPASEALVRAIVQANATVHETARAIPSRSGMGCTVVAVALVEAEAVIAWAGDSRAYRIRERAAEQLTEDHSWVAEQVRQGIITEEQAETSAYRNVITRSLGAEAHMTPDVRIVPIQAGDILLLCSDGLTGVVDDQRLAKLAVSSAPSMACAQLINEANSYGGPDNITAALIRIDRIDAPTPPDPETTEAPTAADAPPRKKRGLFGRGG